MATYALIDNNSGYLWAILDASNPLLAAKATDENLGCWCRPLVGREAQNPRRMTMQRLVLKDETDTELLVAPLGGKPGAWIPKTSVREIDRKRFGSAKTGQVVILITLEKR
jgi:hypothetical protein